MSEEQKYGNGNPPPNDGEIAQLKAQFAGRELVLVEMVDGEDVFSFVMTRPTKLEFTKYRQDVLKVQGDVEKIEDAVERGALAQIRWPDRARCKEIFETAPGLVQNFSDELKKLARVEVEVRSKKL